MAIRWGIIGSGDVAEVKSGPGFQRARGSQLVAVMRRRGDLAADFARRHGVPRWYDDAAALIADPEVDAVYIATPPGTHRDYAVQVCAAGKPAYVEKPMARNHAECREMLAAFTAAGLPLFVAYYRRALPRFLKARELIQEGRLGTVTSVAQQHAGHAGRDLDQAALPWRLRAEEAGGGLFLDLGCHTLDILDFLLGPLSEVQGAAANVASPYAVEDSVAMTFRAGGALGTGAWNFASALPADRIEIRGTVGRLALSTFGDEPVELVTAAGRETFTLPNPPHIQQPLIQAIVDALHGEGECPSTGVTAARTSLVIDQVLAGYYGGRDDAFWERPESWPGRRRERA
jgi:predicted dehydrogenase